jgi:tetratricopeptide (TPR) repeat protein
MQQALWLILAVAAGDDPKVLEVGNGLKVSGTLDKAKSRQVYRVKLHEGGTYVIDMVSPNPKALDPLLRLTEPAGKVLAVDDDGGVSYLSARIVFLAPATATYRIEATSANGAGIGPYTLKITRDDSKKAAVLLTRVSELLLKGDYVSAAAKTRELFETQKKALGPGHWETVDAWRFLEELDRIAALPEAARTELTEAIRQNILANRLRAKHSHAQAAPHFEKALAIRQKILGEESRSTGQSYNNLALNLKEQGKYADAAPLLGKTLDISVKVHGEEHPVTATCYGNLASNLDAQRKYAEAAPLYEKALAIRRKVLGDEHRDVAQCYNDLAVNLHTRGKYAEAAPNFEKALAIRRKILGEEHPHTATSYHNLAFNLHAQAKYAEAAPLYRKALIISRKVLGEEHAETATIYDSLGNNLGRQGKYADAALRLEKALNIRRKILGEDHADTARNYNNLASNLEAQGKYADAAPLYERALRILRKAPGEGHPSTATSYNNLAGNLQARGRYADAAIEFERALMIRRKILGEAHPDTAMSYNNLATNLEVQGKYAEAAPLHEKALAILRKAMGEEHPSTATSCNNLAYNLSVRGKYTEAARLLERSLNTFHKILGEEHAYIAIIHNNMAHNLHTEGKDAAAAPHYEKALAIFRKALGEEVSATAESYHNLAVTLYARGKYAEAAESFHKALAIFRRSLGEQHPTTCISRGGVALNLHAQGKYAEAEAFAATAAESFAVSRLRSSASGLQRASFAAEHSPYTLLAACQARNGKADAAWRSLEAGLARGLLDDLSAQQALPLTPAEQEQQRSLNANLNRLDKEVDKLLAGPARDATAGEQLAKSIGQRTKTEADLAQLAATLAERQVYELARIQRQVPPDAALLAWVDTKGKPKAKDPSGEHWACLLRRDGPPVWVKLPGSGRNGAWTKDDDELPGRFRFAVADQAATAAADVTALKDKLSAQRLAPLVPHLAARNRLAAVRRLIVVPAGEMAGVPVEALSDDYLVSYIPSGSTWARLQELNSPTMWPTLLAVGDPVFRASEKGVAYAGPAPKHGIFIMKVLPGSNAAKNGLKAEDILLRYGDVKLEGPADLARAVKAQMPHAAVAVTLWRAGKTFAVNMPAGALGVQINLQPAGQVVLAQRDADRIIRASRGDGYNPLPGSRAEVEAIARLLPQQATLKLLGSEASEQNLADFASRGELKKYRYVHFATHGDVNPRIAFQSAIILAQDHLPEPADALRGKDFLDGRLTAAELLNWKLDAEMVVLSACQTGLGQKAGGEGYLGFSQALFLAGARSLVVSLWKVDDTATALLMVRFYENLLGRRAGLKTPLPKAEALAEAKRWLRGLTAKEAERLTKNLPSAERIGTASGRPRPATASARPYEHPYYWAAFILIGDPR